MKDIQGNKGGQQSNVWPDFETTRNNWTPIEEALSIDPTLAYNEEEEDYGSEEGYWMEDNLETEKVMSITIFIKELLDDDLFFTYEWAK